MTKKLHIKTYGCQMNVYDSQRMAEVLAPLGYQISEQADDADLVVLNTCHIREKAAEKVFSDLGRLKPLQQEKAERGGRMLLAVAGCVAQAEGSEIVARAPYVDIVLGPQTYHRLPELVAAAHDTGKPVVDTEFPAEAKFEFLPETLRFQGISSFLTIQEGCDKFCTFCVVPYTRGAEFSRPVLDILAEARRLTELGAREITLLGQNVNAYHGMGPDGSEWGLGRLIHALAGIPEIARLRYTTSHPNDMDDALIEAHRDVKILMPFLHLPVQSGSDRMLDAMNRRHTVAQFRHSIDRLRRMRSDMAFSSDFIVGYPGESDADFAATLALVTEIGFAQAFSFKYSPRPGTQAADRTDQVSEPVKTERLDQLQRTLLQQQRAFNLAKIGTTLPVLFEKPGRHPGQLTGRSPYLQAVHAPAPAILTGRIVPVHIVAAETNSLAGSVPGAAAEPGDLVPA